MKLAFNLARSRKGLTGDNPSVGCVIVKKDQIISIGRTGFKGKPHAEYNAVENSYENPKGSKMYVTLEPCNHYGKTPPCTKKIIKSGISEVYYPLDDIDKKVKGKSFKILSKNKIKVYKGILSKESKKFYKSYNINRSFKIPFVIGKIAVAKNDLIYSKFNRKITNEHSDKFTHLLRYKNDSILITYKTLNKDNPKLNCRLKGFENFSPKRIILDNKLETKLNSYIIKTANLNNTIIFYNKAKKSKILEFKKKKIFLLKSKVNKNNDFDFNEILKKLFKYGCRNLLVEGGATLTGKLLRKRIFDEFYLFRGTKIIPKSAGYLAFNDLKLLKKKFKNKINLNLNLGKDKITLYKK
tara:strand:- start:40 stop:1101 length:1062 start_codon:yes stop_codon:yes gene_type:complete